MFTYGSKALIAKEKAELAEPALPLPGTPASCLLWEQLDRDINKAAWVLSPNPSDP